MDMANQFLSLSLFIMLLSFFIILNALSNFDENKSQPVLNSLATAFSSEQPKEVLLPNTTISPVESVKEGSTLDKLEVLFNSTITGVKVSQNRMGTMMHVRMPIAQFESSLMEPTLQNSEITQRLGAPGSFLPTLLSLMQTRETEIPYRMDMILNTAEEPAKSIVDNADQTRIDMQRIASFAQRLEESGLPRKLVSGGLARGEPDMVDIYFTHYIPVNPLEKRGIANE